MAFELKDGEGSLWRITEKKEGDDRDYNGSIKITKPGEYWLSGHVNTTKAGKKYLKLTAKPKQAQAERREDQGDRDSVFPADILPFSPLL